MLQHLADGRVDLMLGRGNTGPVYPWFGQDIRDGIALAIENYAPAAPAVARGRRRLGGQVPHSAAVVHLDAAPAGRRTAVRLARVDPQPGDRRAGGVLRRRVLREPHLLAEGAHRADGRALPAAVRALRPRQRRPGHRRPRRPGVHAARTSQDAVNEFRPYFDNAPVYGHGPSLEDFSAETPLTVGSPQQVIERTLGFREYVGDYQRQLFLVDHAGLPLKTVLEQLDLLGAEVVPVLRKEFAARPAGARPGRPDPRPAAGRPSEASATPDRSSSGGLSQPSSTRLLADRLAEATTPGAGRRRGRPDRAGRAARPRARHHRQPADRLPERRPPRGHRGASPGPTA